MGDLERRLRNLEAVHATGVASETPVENGSCRDFFEAEMEWISLDLLRGREPYFTLGEDDAFRTVGGKFAVSLHRLNIQGLFRKDPTPEEQAISAERWERLLSEDDEAADALERLLALAESALVPGDYRMPNFRWHDLGEINDRMGDPDLGSVFLDADERERVRRMVYALINVPDARALLCFITKRRDLGVDEEGREVSF
jgi:hypothetical protein